MVVVGSRACPAIVTTPAASGSESELGQLGDPHGHSGALVVAHRHGGIANGTQVLVACKGGEVGGGHGFECSGRWRRLEWHEVDWHTRLGCCRMQVTTATSSTIPSLYYLAVSTGDGPEWWLGWGGVGLGGWGGWGALEVGGKGQ